MARHLPWPLIARWTLRIDYKDQFNRIDPAMGGALARIVFFFYHSPLVPVSCPHLTKHFGVPSRRV